MHAGERHREKERQLIPSLLVGERHEGTEHVTQQRAEGTEGIDQTWMGLPC